MDRAYLPKALALTLLTAGLSLAGAQQAQPAQDATAPQQAVPHRRHAPDPQHQTDYLAKRLNLSADQTAKVEPILATRDQQLQAVRENQQLAPQDRHQQMRTINETAQQQMAGVLTPEQLEQFKAMRHHRGHHGPDSAPAPATQSPS